MGHETPFLIATDDGLYEITSTGSRFEATRRASMDNDIDSAYRARIDKYGYLGEVGSMFGHTLHIDADGDIWVADQNGEHDMHGGTYISHSQFMRIAEQSEAVQNGQFERVSDTYAIVRESDGDSQFEVTEHDVADDEGPYTFIDVSRGSGVALDESGDMWFHTDGGHNDGCMASRRVTELAHIVSLLDKERLVDLRSD